MTSPGDDEAMKMARRIAADVLFNEGMVSLAAQVRSGRRDGLDTVKSALAAIIETQERCAALAESRDGYNDITGTLIAAAIRSGQQFRKDV